MWGRADYSNSVEEHHELAEQDVGGRIRLTTQLQTPAQSIFLELAPKVRTKRPGCETPPSQESSEDSQPASRTAGAKALDRSYICLCFRRRAKWMLRQTKIKDRRGMKSEDQALFRTIRDAVEARKLPKGVQGIPAPFRVICETVVLYRMTWIVPVSVATVSYH